MYNGDTAPYQQLRSAAVRLREGGSAQARSKFEAQLQAFLEAPLAPQGAAFDFTSRARELVSLVDDLAGDEGSSFTLRALVQFISNAKMKGEEPTAWIVAARFLLTLTSYRDPAIASLARRELAETKDPDLRAYGLVNSRIGLVPPYDASLQSRVGHIMSSY
ncbi:MAG: hypothetical protein WBY44_31095 [Bryobacteraceae bacterium]